MYRSSCGRKKYKLGQGAQGVDTLPDNWKDLNKCRRWKRPHIDNLHHNYNRLAAPDIQLGKPEDLNKCRRWN